MDWSKLHKLVEAVNTYYAFTVLLYVAVIYVSSHSQIFLWILLALTPVIAGWTGWLLQSYFAGRNEKHGFRLLDHVMTYEVLGGNRYRYSLQARVRAEANRLMVYPVGYQWSGEGPVYLPQIRDKGQHLVGTVENYNSDTAAAHVAPYKEIVASEADWNYWFVGFDRALYRGEIAEIHYTQDFYDAKKKAKPCFYHMVNSSVKKLEMNVRFPADALPTTVTASYFSLKDRRRVHMSKEIEYSPDKQWVTWTVKKPKFGYCYRIDWQ